MSPTRPAVIREENMSDARTPALLAWAKAGLVISLIYMEAP